jgi:DNA-binding transcriptional regulator YdaS (Cro superfamily)
MNENPISRAIQIAGGVTKLARALGVSYQAVRKWEKHQPPATRCVAIEAATDRQVTRYELRPDLRDLFGPSPEQCAAPSENQSDAGLQDALECEVEAAD